MQNMSFNPTAYEARQAERLAAVLKARKRFVGVSRNGGIWFFRVGRVSGSLAISRRRSSSLPVRIVAHQLAGFVAGLMFGGIAI